VLRYSACSLHLSYVVRSDALDDGGSQMQRQQWPISHKTRSKGIQIAVFPAPPLQRMLLFKLSQVVAVHEFILVVGT
jgi:hypothetical protein